MTEKEKGTMWGGLLILILVIATRGFSTGWNLIKQVFEVLKVFLGFLWTIIIRFPDELGITDWLWTRGIFAVISIIAVAVFGYTFTRKEKKLYLEIISAVIGLISTVLMFI